MDNILLPVSLKNYFYSFLVTLPANIKQEPFQDILDRKSRPPSPHMETLTDISMNRSEVEIQHIPSTSIAASSISPLTLQSSKRFQPVQSMIAVRKDYSYKYTQSKVSSITPHEKISNSCLDISSSPHAAIPTVKSSVVVVGESKKDIVQRSSLKKGHAKIQSSEPLKQACSNKPNISILERHDYNKSSLKVTALKAVQAIDEETKPRAIEDVTKLQSLQPKVMVENLNTNILKVPIGAMMKRAEMLAKESDQPPAKKQKKKKKKKKERSDEDLDDSSENVKVIVAQKVESAPSTTTVKQEPGTEANSRQSTESSKDSQNINKINNKINIIFQLNDNSKSLRKNIILHRRAPKKMTKITIKEANNNINSNSSKTQAESDPTMVPEKSKILCSIETQTEESIASKNSKLNMSNTYPLQHDDITEHLFFENDILICVSHTTISFYDYYRLSALLKKGESDFRLIDRVARRLHDVCVDNDNKFQRLCYNEENPLPIYVEMRAKQKELDDPESCPIAFVYCNVYYLDQNNAKFSSVHLDTVKSVTCDICYTTIPKSCYFVMAWSEKSLDMKTYITGLVKYKLTPNLDLAKLASIRQFPKVYYRIKQMYCGKGKYTNAISVA